MLMQMNYRDRRVESRSKAAKRTVLLACACRDGKVESRSKAAKRTVLFAWSQELRLRKGLSSLHDEGLSSLHDGLSNGLLDYAIFIIMERPVEHLRYTIPCFYVGRASEVCPDIVHDLIPVAGSGYGTGEMQ
jgi:hypothetical protein